MSESKFCERDRELAKLAQEFVDANKVPVIPSIVLEILQIAIAYLRQQLVQIGKK